MADLGRSFTPPREQPEKPPNVVKAVVRTAPADANDELTVLIPSFADSLIYEIRFWTARGALLPSEGDEGIVGFLEDGEPWLISYWTADTTAGGVAAHTHTEGDITDLVADRAGKQPLDSDLTAIAALSTTAYGRALLALADAAAARTYIGAAATSHTHAQSDITGLVAALAALQPLDSDLTAIAALTTTSFGRSLLTMADAAATRTALSLVIGVDVQAFDSDLASIAALSTTAFGRGLLTEASAASLRSTLALVIGTNVQAWDADLDALAGLASAANKLPYATGAQTWALTDLSAFARTILDDADAAAVRTTIGVTGLLVPTSSLPATPADGDEVIYIVDTSVLWHLKYRSTTNKWHYIGGPPMFVEVTTAETLAAGAGYQALATGGPSITVPLAGDYDVEIGATMFDATAGATLWMSYDIGGTGAVDADAANSAASTAGDFAPFVSVARLRRKTGLAASTALVSKYKRDLGTGNWRNRWMKVTPVRLDDV